MGLAAKCEVGRECEGSKQLQKRPAGNHKEFSSDAEEEMAAFMNRNKNAVHQAGEHAVASLLVEEEKIERDPSEQRDTRKRLPRFFQLFQSRQPLGP